MCNLAHLVYFLQVASTVGGAPSGIDDAGCIATDARPASTDEPDVAFEPDEAGLFDTRLLQTEMLKRTAATRAVPERMVSAVEATGDVLSERQETASTGLLESSSVMSQRKSKDLQLSALPQLCEKNIVRQTCSMLRKATACNIGTDTDNNLEMASACKLSERLMVKLDDITRFLTHLPGLTNHEADPAALANNAFGVNCTELCTKIVTNLPPTVHVPPTSDVGCIVTAAGQPPTCNVNLSPETIATIAWPQHPIHDRLVRSGEGGTSSASGLSYQEMSDDELKTMVLRLFRIHVNTRMIMNLDAASFQNMALLNMAPPSGPLDHATQSDRLQRINLQSQAVISTALNAMADHAVPDLVTKWFGNNEQVTRLRIFTVLSDMIAKVLDNVVYVYPGVACDATTYAYVDASDQPPCDPITPCARDASVPGAPYPYVVQLCDIFFTSTDATMVKTIVHEAAHHLPINVDDQVYGLDGSLALATNDPAKALDNADNFCYFVAEVNVAAQNTLNDAAA